MLTGAGGELRFSERWEDIAPAARAELTGAEVAMVTSYCPDGVAASELILDSAARLCFVISWVSEVGISTFGAEEVQEWGLPRTAELLIGQAPRIHWYSLFDLPKWRSSDPAAVARRR